MGLKQADEGAGLAFLVTDKARPSPAGQPWQLGALIDYVLDLDATDHAAAATTSASSRFEDVETLMEARCRRVSTQQAPAEDASQPSTSQPGTSQQYQEAAGRLGPRLVRIDDASVAGHFHQRAEGGLELESLENFSSCRANVCVFKGKWFYEATVLTSGIQQIGWATLQCPFTAEEGVGDAPDSYALDGKRVRKWNVKPQPYGEAWAQGDVIGCAIDLDAGTLSFSRNGASLGIAYEHVRTMQPSLAYFPALSLSHAERCSLNFGGRPFAHAPPPGYLPLQAAPPVAESAEAGYLCASLGRLVRAAAGVGTGPDSGSGGAAGPARPEDAFLPRAPLAWADAVLLGGAIVARLQPLLSARPYLVHSELLTLLVALHRSRESHRPALVAAAVRVLELGMEPQAFAGAMERVLEHLSNNCRTAQLIPEHAPYTAAYPHLALARTLLQSRVVRNLWLRHPDFLALTEGFLTRKSPGQGDLKGLLPHVWWQGCREEGAAEEKLEASMRMLRITIAQVEDAQFALMSILLSEPDPLDPSSSAFLAFLRHLLHKNRASLRDVPPPGLSDHTVIWGTFWVLLRLLQPVLAAAGQGARSSLTSFPVADLFASTSGDAEFLPTYDMPRLGGIITHMTRETPLTPADRAPVPVTAPAVPQPPAYQDTSPPPTIPDAVLPELLNGAMLLYCWRVGLSLRMLASLSAALASSRASLEEMERMAEVPSAASQAWLQDARAYYRDEVTRDVRLLTLLKVAFFSAHKQQALAALGAYLSALVLAAGPAGSNLLAYVPNVYVECPVDFLHALRRTESGSDLQPQAPGVQAFVSLLACTLDDARILNPDVKESLLQCTSLVLDSPQWAAAFEANPSVRQRLVPSVLTIFDSRLWHPASNVLLRLVRDSGFGLVQSRGSGLSPLQLLLRDEMASGQDGAAFKGFLTRLFNTLNWTLTEFTVAVSDLHEQRGRRMMLEARQQFRRTGLMFELSVNLLRIMEFVAAQAPQTFVGGPAVNLSRLLELLPFVLADFTTGPAARKLAELLGRSASSGGAAAPAAAAAPVAAGAAGPSAAGAGAGAAGVSAAVAQPAGAAATAVGAAEPAAAAAGADAAAPVALVLPGAAAGGQPGMVIIGAPGAASGAVQVVGGSSGGAAARLERNTLAERVNKPSILAPVLGIVLGLWEASSTGAAAADAAGGDAASSSGQRNVFVEKLAGLADARFMEHLKFVQDLDWCSAFPNVPLSDQLRALRQFVEALEATRQAQEARAADRSQGPDESEVPDDFLDPITMTVMEDPVKLPDSQVTVDRSTIERHLLSGQGTDPFSRAPLTLEQVQPHTALKARMQAWWASGGKEPQQTASGGKEPQQTASGGKEPQQTASGSAAMEESDMQVG